MSYISQNNAYKVIRVSSLPTTGELGALYLNTTTKVLWIYDGINGWITNIMFSDFVYDYYARYNDIPVGGYANKTRKLIVLLDETDSEITNSYESVNGILRKTLGKSAYQVAVDNGFSGSQTDWLVSIQGKVGKSLGAYNVATNTPTLTAIPSSSFVDGDYYDLITSGSISFGGVNFTSGSQFFPQDQLKKIGNQWYRVPFAIGDYTISSQKISKNAKIIKSWEAIPYSQFAQVIYTDGVLYEANLDTSPSDIPSVSSKWSVVLIKYDTKININESNFDSLQKRTLGEYIEKPNIGATTRWDFASTLLNSGNIIASVGLDRLITWTGQTDNPDNGFVSYKDVGITATGRVGNTIVFSATIGTIRTTSPMIGIGWDNGADKVSILLRSTGRISSYIKGTGFSDYQLDTTAQAFVTGDIVTIEVRVTSSGVTFRCARNGVFSPYYTFNKTLQGNLYIVNRGSLDFTSGKFLYKTYSEIQSNIDNSLSLVQDYIDTKEDVLQTQIDNITIASVNILPPNFTSGSYYKITGDGSILSASGWIRTTNKIPVLPNTQYTFCGIDTQFVGNEYDSSGVIVRNIAPNIDPPNPRYSFVTFTTSPTTTQLGLNITSSGGSDSSNTAMLVLGSNIPSYEEYGDRYIDALKVRGDLVDYTKTSDLVTILPNIFYSVNTTGYSGRLIIYVYVKYSILSKYYIRYQVANDYDVSTRKDLYRIVGADLFKFDGSNMISQSKTIIANGESEFEFLQRGKSDITGGFHGDEKYTDIKFFVNGLVLDVSSNIPLTPANEFSYIQKSNMYETDNPTDTIIANHHKRTTFSLGGYKTENRLIGVASSILLDITYFGIVSISREQSEIFFDENYNYFVANSDNNEKIGDVGAREVNYYSNTNKLGAKVTSEITKPVSYDTEAVMYVWDSSANNHRKYHRRLLNKTLTSGSVWEGSCTVKHSEFL